MNAPASVSNSTAARTIRVNGQTRRIGAEASVADLVNALGLSRKRVAVERNGEIVPKSRYADTRIEDGDRIEIVGAVGGG